MLSRTNTAAEASVSGTVRMIEDVLETATSTVLWNELVSSLPPAAAQENQSRGRPTPVAETPGVADAAASELDTETSIGLAFVPQMPSYAAICVSRVCDFSAFSLYGQAL